MSSACLVEFFSKFYSVDQWSKTIHLYKRHRQVLSNQKLLPVAHRDGTHPYAVAYLKIKACNFIVIVRKLICCKLYFKLFLEFI